MSSNSPPSSVLVAGKYQLITMIGRGGMGSVWEGRHTSLGTRVAIKFIEAEFANSQEARSRFDNEAKAAATIQSKHAIQIYDHGVTEDGKPYIVMEMLTGEPLDKRIERLGRLPLQDVARIFQQVARGLGRAHERGIIHRDLKPENIFLVINADDDDEVAKVLDFGIAKIKGTAGQQLSNSTKTGAVLGTPYFMSPEQARGVRDIDHRTDLWSLGVIVFKCVTGVLPFDGESLGDLLVKICTTQIPVPSQVLPGLPPAFDAWFARALEREPQKRFASALEMSDALSYACGVSVRRPAHHVPDPSIGNARTLATPPPMNSPFPQGGMHTPNASSSGSHAQVVSNPGTMPTPYGGVPFRASVPNATPAQAAFATQSPLTASTSGAKASSNILTIVGVAVVCVLVGGGGVFVLSRGHASAGPPPVPPASLTGTAATIDVSATLASAKASATIPDISAAATGGKTQANEGTSGTTPEPKSQTKTAHVSHTNEHPTDHGTTTGTATKPPKVTAGGTGGSNSADQSGF